MKLKNGPIILIILGVILLIGNFNLIDNAFLKLWPLLLIGIGITHLVNAIYKN